MFISAIQTMKSFIVSDRQASWLSRTLRSLIRLHRHIGGGALKMQDLKMQDQIAGVENAGPENAGPPVNTANR